MNILSVKAKEQDKRVGVAYRGKHFGAHSEVS